MSADSRRSRSSLDIARLRAIIPKELKETWARIEWANTRINELNTAISEFLDMKPYRAEPIENDTESPNLIVQFEQRFDPPIKLALIFGEAMSHLRCALDLMACQLVLKNGSPVGGMTSFPIYTKLSGDTRADVMRFVDERIKGAHPKAIDIVKDLQPDRSPDGSVAADPLTLIHEFNRIDKHQALVHPGVLPELCRKDSTPIKSVLYHNVLHDGARIHIPKRDREGTIAKRHSDVAFGMRLGFYLDGKTIMLDGIEFPFIVFYEHIVQMHKFVRDDVLSRFLRFFQ